MGLEILLHRCWLGQLAPGHQRMRKGQGQGVFCVWFSWFFSIVKKSRHGGRQGWVDVALSLSVVSCCHGRCSFCAAPCKLLGKRFCHFDRRLVPAVHWAARVTAADFVCRRVQVQARAAIAVRNRPRGDAQHRARAARVGVISGARREISGCWVNWHLNRLADLR